MTPPIDPLRPVPQSLPWWSLAGLLATISLATASLAGAAEGAPRSIADWQRTAAEETQQQVAAESAGDVRTLLLEQWAYLYNVVPIASLPHLTRWWQERGETMMHGWLGAGCPLLTDRDHLMCFLCAVYDAYATQKTTLLGSNFSATEVAAMASLTARIEASGGEVMTAAYLSGTLTPEAFTQLRFYAIKTKYFWGRLFNMPFSYNLSGPASHHLSPGDRAPTIVVATYESVLKSPAYRDLPPGQSDFLLAFHSDITKELLGLLAGYVRVGTTNAVVDRTSPSPFTTVTLPDPKRHRPMALIFTAPNDSFWWWVSSPPFEALHQQTKDRMDWYVVYDTIFDPTMAGVNPLLPGADDQFHETTMEERARRAKAYSLMNPDLSIPLLIDDMANHAQNAFLDLGGQTTVFLVDQNGVITYDSRSDAVMAYLEPSGSDFQLDSIPHNQSALELNIAVLLANHGTWNGSPTSSLPDWQRSEHVDCNTGKGVITAVSQANHTITVTTSGPDLTVAVDPLTRIISPPSYASLLTLADLAAGMKVYVGYDTVATAPGGHLARLIQVGGWVNSQMYWTNHRWLPGCVTATGSDGHDLTVEVRMGPKQEMTGYSTFMATAGPTTPKPPYIALIDQFTTVPKPIVHLHLDRSTEVVVNGMHQQPADIKPGDAISFEILPGILTTADGYLATFVRVHRY